jgi:hypothetical protein
MIEINTDAKFILPQSIVVVHLLAHTERSWSYSALQPFPIISFHEVIHRVPGEK